MRRPRFLTSDRVIGAAVFFGAILIFLSDMTPIRGAADGAAYTLIVALAGMSGERAMVRAAALGAVLTIIGPLIGAEQGETLLQIVSGRFFGLVVIAVLTGVLFHQLKARAMVTALDLELADQNKALLEMTRTALFADTPLKQCFECITELTCRTLNADAVAVGQLVEAAPHLTFIDIWNRHLGRHYIDTEVPASSIPRMWNAATRANPIVADDVSTSEMLGPALSFFAQRGIRALLHVPALYRERTIASLGISHKQPHHWTEREIAFAKSVANVVAVVLTVHQCEQTVERLDFVKQGIFFEGPDGRIEYANRAARELDSGAAGGLPFELAPLAASSDEIDIVHNGRDLEVYRRRLPDGGVLIRVDDVTVRNAALAETKRMQARLEQSSKLHAMGRLASGVAHDFNNILSAIMGFAQVLSRMLETRPSELAFAERILSVCMKGKGITEEILAFARTSSVERQRVDLAEVLGGSLDVVPDEKPGASKILINVPHEPLPINGNGAQLMQLIQNLVINARHACEGIEGRITITAGRALQQEVRDLVRRPGNRNERLLGVPHDAKDYCFLRVDDNGCGIAPDIMVHIFEPFFTTKGHRQGSGLGLAIVHGVVDSHEGCCHVRSEVGVGTVFTIYLPLLAEMPQDFSITNAAFAGDGIRKRAGAGPA